MATQTPTPALSLDMEANAARIDRLFKLKLEAQKKVIDYGTKILEKAKQFTGIYDKMDDIDIAYARHKAIVAKSTDGIDTSPNATASCDIFSDDDVTPPVVVAQVDTYVAYLAEVFLSGAPLFPVLSGPAKRMDAEKLEALVDTHASIGGYARQLLMFLRDGAKYNFCALEASWDSISQFSVLDDIQNPRGKAAKKQEKKYTRITRLNPRNVIWDYTVPAGDVSEHGDYAGYLERLTRTKFKRRLNKWAAEGKGYNLERALLNTSTNVAGYSANFRDDPQISNYVPHNTRNGGIDWEAHFEGHKGRRGQPSPQVTGAIYELFTFYARIMPADYAIQAPGPNTPQIWKFIISNGSVLVYAERVISAYDYLPILFGQPLEDGLGYQTQSIAEGAVPFQKAASTLFNIRFAAARRAVSDRALYIPDMIKPSDINAKASAPKIPVSISQLSQKGISDAYHQIPFDMRGTETTIQDASLIVGFSKDLHGVNGPRQGQFQKGNKSVSEWNDTMGGSDGRMRLPALTLEHQVFSPLKSIITLNIFQYGEDGVVTSQVTGLDHDIKIDELRKAALSFKMADGYTPRSKLASTEIILAGMQMIGQSEVLQQAYGQRLPGMFAHFMSLSGVKGFEEYDPQRMAQADTMGMQGNSLQPEQPSLPGPVAPVPANSTPPV